MADNLGRQFCNAPVHVRTLFGTGQLPGFIWEPWIFPARYNVNMTFADFSGYTHSIRPYLEGVAFAAKEGDQDAWIVALWKKLIARMDLTHPFWQTTDAPIALTGNQVGSQTDLKIGDNLRLFSMAVVATGDFSITVSDMTRNQLLMNARIAASAGLGNAQYPTIFKKPWTIPSGSRIRITLDDLSGENNTVYVTFSGRKILTSLNDAEAMTDFRDPIQRKYTDRVGVLVV